ncbi:uncharacterized protein LOC120272470 [Dioscorea cayenensis subsp. rotundata]|uniref:Uncharacterized protein LOC120272470 n=1 Tax=Dioscorea cayennensis subsp. rotundata TaxID=55577 RepID=A0AB40C639_DIOCR|nr:uncharacterized protein LOC120272470 [Dioscorea cayenensis subsp. rotundata]
MELPMVVASNGFHSFNAIRVSRLRLSSIKTPVRFNSHRQERNAHNVFAALPETAATVVLAAVAVGAGSVLLSKTKQASVNPTLAEPLKVCEDCGGSGICSACNGEGFILKKLSEESADRARMTAKNMATRYTAGLPKKWSYCMKCSSARSCSTCGGSGKLS